MIPARGGSKGIPRKNLREVGGLSLLAWACAAATGAGLDRVTVSTDDAEIAAAARREGVEAAHRPPALAGDDVPMLPVIQNVLASLEPSGYVPDAVVLLQPTSPLRRADHVRAAIELFARTAPDSVVTVTRVPHRFVPSSLLVVAADGRATPYQAGPAPLRRQDKAELYARNGPAVLVARRETLLGGSLYGADSRALVMSPEDSIDVDDEWDLRIADLALRAR